MAGMKRLFLLAPILAVIALAVWFTWPKEKAIVAFSPSIVIKAEIADSGSEMAKGLMFRKYLGQNEGMLFVFPDSAVRTFWMKNTLIPLDMIFIAENKTIVKIHHAIPCESEKCPMYGSGLPAKYVLEVNANFTLAYGIKEGDKAEIKRP
jgi:uncharacterized protein